jgi:hypothetical protein
MVVLLIKTMIVNEIMVLGEVPDVLLMTMYHVNHLVIVVLMILKEDLLVTDEVMILMVEEDLLVIVEEMILMVEEDLLVIVEEMILMVEEDLLVIVEEMILMVEEDHLVIVVMMILTVEEDRLVSAVMISKVDENHLVNLEEDLVLNEMMICLILVIIH